MIITAAAGGGACMAMRACGGRGMPRRRPALAAKYARRPAHLPSPAINSVCLCFRLLRTGTRPAGCQASWRRASYVGRNVASMSSEDEVANPLGALEQTPNASAVDSCSSEDVESAMETFRSAAGMPPEAVRALQEWMQQEVVRTPTYSLFESFTSALAPVNYFQAAFPCCRQKLVQRTRSNMAMEIDCWCSVYVYATDYGHCCCCDHNFRTKLRSQRSV
jgi:hypothetical protein